ncbi:DUF4283 domain protein [Quillaja saponaria]|uniref:DUF4283 domain protein n=1 Tax=Quillaja saponaria TaxID=32244 RepID=A0AAD7PDC0_QUISA|nr:DUF4283 domain protein [Quillaja saponaria]
MELGDNCFQFFFDEEIDFWWILKRGSWLFKNQLLLLTRWDRDIEKVKGGFQRVSLWIQLWGLSSGCCIAKMVKKLGDLLGLLLEVEIFGVQEKQGCIIKCLVDWNLATKLRKSMIALGAFGEKYKVNLQYEKLHTFCFYCSLIGHDEQMKLKGEMVVAKEPCDRLSCLSMQGSRRPKCHSAVENSHHQDIHEEMETIKELRDKSSVTDGKEDNYYGFEGPSPSKQHLPRAINGS